LVRRSCCRCIFHTGFSATGARRHWYHRSLCSFTSSAGVLEAELTQQLPLQTFSCSSAADARRGCCAFAVHETAAGSLVLHGIGSPCTCTCVDVYWIAIARLQRQCQYAGYLCELLYSQRLLPPQHVPPPRFAVHEAAAGAVRLHGIGSPCTCVHVPLIVIARLSLQSWHLLLCLGTCCSETTSAAVLVIARLPLALFSRQALALSASMALAAHARAFLCQPTWIVIACWQR